MEVLRGAGYNLYTRLGRYANIVSGFGFDKAADVGEGHVEIQDE